jgi:aflatoxin B1 aldehyde reductase
MSFWAYSPLAGGFLVHNPDSVMNGWQKRFDQNLWLGKMYRKLYGRPRLLEALPKWHAIAEEAGCSVSALAYRWVAYNSVLSSANSDAMIVGATKTTQLEQTLDDLSGGPLSEKIVQRIDSIWASVQDEAPLDNFHY